MVKAKTSREVSFYGALTSIASFGMVILNVFYPETLRVQTASYSILGSITGTSVINLKTPLLIIGTLAGITALYFYGKRKRWF